MISNENQELFLELVDAENESEHLFDTPRVKGMNKLFSEIVLGPINIVRQCLLKNTFIGPLREIPDRNFRPWNSSDESRWENGLGAWDLIHKDADGKLIDIVNEWISDKSSSGIPYEIKRIKFNAKLPNEEKELTRDEIFLIHKEKNLLVKPSDVGVGITQLLPVVISVLSHKFDLLSIEQPELHIHPELPVFLGDLFIHATENKTGDIGKVNSLLIETHSEHLLLRLLRRVRV